jgi:hypothetical protein
MEGTGLLVQNELRRGPGQASAGPVLGAAKAPGFASIKLSNFDRLSISGEAIRACKSKSLVAENKMTSRNIAAKRYGAFICHLQ